MRRKFRSDSMRDEMNVGAVTPGKVGRECVIGRIHPANGNEVT
jgi:hypothetical protein